MTEKKTTLISLPIMDNIATRISETGEYREHLNNEELTELVGGSIKLAMDDYKVVDPTVKNVVVEIRDGKQLFFSAEINTTTPVARVNLSVIWENDKTPGVLKATALTLNSDYSEAAKVGMFLSGIDMNLLIENSVRDPNGALSKVLKQQMGLRNVELAGAGFIVEPEGTLRVVVQGKKKTL